MTITIWPSNSAARSTARRPRAVTWRASRGAPPRVSISSGCPRKVGADLPQLSDPSDPRRANPTTKETPHD